MQLSTVFVGFLFRITPTSAAIDKAVGCGVSTLRSMALSIRPLQALVMQPLTKSNNNLVSLNKFAISPLLLIRELLAPTSQLRQK